MTSRFPRALLAVALAALALAGCADPEETTPLHLRGQGLLIADLPELGGDYPAILIDGLSRQLIDEVNCIQPGVLVEFEVADLPGHISTTANIPHMLRPEAVAAAEAVADADNDFLTITSGYRDVAMQYYDYLRGQRYGFLAARPGNSRHQAGQAIDVEHHTTWRDKLIAGGWDWPLGTRDAPHFEWVENNTPDLRAESVRAFQRLWNRNNPGDLIAEDGDFGPMTEARLAVSPSEGFADGGCDLDLDGHADPAIGGDDCDDTRDDVHPDATDLCGDGLDQDCTGDDLPCEPTPDASLDTGADDADDTRLADDALPAEDADPDDDTADPPDADRPQPDAANPDLPDTAGLNDAPRPIPPSVAQVNDASCACQTPPPATPPTTAPLLALGLLAVGLGLGARLRR